jgi:uncharacterized protein (DUF1778 family)
MPKKQIQETARVEFRMPPSLKKEVEDAAALLGATFTSFATETLVERSRQVKRDHAMTVLCDKERDAFLKMIELPPTPSVALVELMHAKVNL